MTGLFALIINTIGCMYKKPRTYDDIDVEDINVNYEEERRG